MSLDYKALKKIADACRKAGITHFKNADFEFTLSPDGPVSNYKKKQNKETFSSNNDILSTDSLTDEQLLMWSALDPSAPTTESVS